MNDLYNVKEIREKIGISQEEFAKMLGVSSRTVQNWERGKKIPDSKREMLAKLSGQTPAKLKPQAYFGGCEESVVSLPLIPLDAVAGLPGDDNDGVILNDCERYTVPEFSAKGAQYLIRVSGTSMLPKYNNGDILACRKIDEMTFFQWGKVYVMDTRQGALVKKVFPDNNNPDNILCVSENKEDFPPFTLPKTEIRSISIVVGVIGVE
jgi:phage repressor protein C with HTH and peptisase S24 domain